MRPYWNTYYNDTDGIIFVIDSANAGRFDENVETLMALLDDDALQGIPFLFFANKNDLPTA
jgi:GTPase SAR1 family protein